MAQHYGQGGQLRLAIAALFIFLKHSTWSTQYCSLLPWLVQCSLKP